MSFTYSYRAFLISCLLVAGVLLFLLNVPLRDHSYSPDEIENLLTNVEILVEDEEKEEEEPQENEEIKTNIAYNEAEKYISETERENREISEKILERLEEETRETGNESPAGTRISNVNPKEESRPADSDKIKESPGSNNASNRQTTISYYLLNRTDVYLPNPVYTCYTAGKIVINIEVDESGSVKKTIFNRNASTSSNQCLIDVALEYAGQARFSSDASRKNQQGSITFNFPGQ